MGRLTAQGIYDICMPVSPEEARPGDIIFFTGTYDAGEPVTHVGIYAGDGQMIHCGNPIQYTSINSAYWQSHFYAFGRPYGGAYLNIERIKEELARTYVKIEKLQKKARDLEEQKKQAEDMEYLKIIRSNGVSAEELQLMIDISKEEQKKILEIREKEQTENEEIS